MEPAIDTIGQINETKWQIFKTKHVMAIKKCRECGKDVSTEAKACPHCGAPSPVRQEMSPAASLGCLTVLAAIVATIWWISASTSAPSCFDNYSLCKNNADLINHYRGIAAATTACQDAVNQSARYGAPKWQDVPFGTFLTGNDYVKSGVINLIDKDVQIPNVFGGVRNTSAFCAYDLKRQRLVTVRVDGIDVLP